MRLLGIGAHARGRMTDDCVYPVRLRPGFKAGIAADLLKRMGGWSGSIYGPRSDDRGARGGDA